MGHQLIESRDSFKVSFGGPSSIDAEAFARTIQNIVHIVQESSKIVDPKCFVRLEINKTQEGSFETILDAIARHTETLFTNTNITVATAIIGGVVGLFQIKKHLGGKKPLRVEIINEEETEITNHKKEKQTFNTQVVNNYFGNTSIDASISQIGSNLQTHKRDFMKITSDSTNKEVYFGEPDYTALSQIIVDGSNIASNNEKQYVIEKCEYKIKQPDLVGDSKWKLMSDKVIDAKILDKDFIQKIKSGEIKISGGYSLVVKLVSYVAMSEDDDQIISVDYTIPKVHGVKDNRDQLELFGG